MRVKPREDRPCGLWGFGRFIDLHEVPEHYEGHYGIGAKSRDEDYVNRERQRLGAGVLFHRKNLIMIKVIIMFKAMTATNMYCAEFADLARPWRMSHCAIFEPPEPE